MSMLAPAAVVAAVAALAGGYLAEGRLAGVAALGALAALALPVAVLLARRAVRFLKPGEQLRIEHFTSVAVHNGPAIVVLNPLGYRLAEVREAASLGSTEYAMVKDAVTGVERAERGPCLLFLGPHDVVASRGEAVCLSDTEYVRVENVLSGGREVLKGPRVWFPSPHERGHKGSCVCLGKTEYITVEDRRSGQEQLVKGPCVWCPGAYEVASEKRTALALRDDEYLRLKDTSSGHHWVQRGQALVFLEPSWKVEGASPGVSGIQKARVLKANQYLRLLDATSGKISVHRGETTVFPGPHDELLDGGAKEAVEVDGEHAVLVRDKTSGQQRLVVEPQLFVPGPNEVIEETRELIRLAEHEAIIIKDKDGVFHYYYGSDEKRGPNQPRSFFLPAGAEIVKVWWSRGPRRERKDVCFERFDCRPHFMKFEFNCRTSDNVELVLEGVIFWELVDLPAMFRHTGDTSGDIVYHIRSQFILHVARVTLRAFMEKLHEISKTVLEEDEAFYATRGIKVYSLEVSRYQCANASTAEILEQIIQETTNRMNRLSQAEGENEVSLFRTQGQVEQAKLSSALLEIQRQQSQAEAKVVGTSEADRVGTFLERLAPQVPALEERIKIWQVLRKTEALSVVSQGGANLYFTPNDVDLSIEAKAVQPAS